MIALEQMFKGWIATIMLSACSDVAAITPKSDPCPEPESGRPPCHRWEDCAWVSNLEEGQTCCVSPIDDSETVTEKGFQCCWNEDSRQMSTYDPSQSICCGGSAFSKNEYDECCEQTPKPKDRYLLTVFYDYKCCEDEVYVVNKIKSAASIYIDKMFARKSKFDLKIAQCKALEGLKVSYQNETWKECCSGEVKSMFAFKIGGANFTIIKCEALTPTPFPLISVLFTAKIDFAGQPLDANTTCDDLDICLGGALAGVGGVGARFGNRAIVAVDVVGQYVLKCDVKMCWSETEGFHFKDGALANCNWGGCIEIKIIFYDGIAEWSHQICSKDVSPET